MSDHNNEDMILSRRALLTRLGLAAGAAYVAPVVMGFGAAQASTASRGGASKKSAPSRGKPSRPGVRGKSARASGPSRPQRRKRVMRRRNRASASRG